MDTPFLPYGRVEWIQGIVGLPFHLPVHLFRRLGSLLGSSGLPLRIALLHRAGGGLRGFGFGDYRAGL